MDSARIDRRHPWPADWNERCNELRMACRQNIFRLGVSSVRLVSAILSGPA